MEFRKIRSITRHSYGDTFHFSPVSCFQADKGEYEVGQVVRVSNDQVMEKRRTRFGSVNGGIPDEAEYRHGKWVMENE